MRVRPKRNVLQAPLAGVVVGTSAGTTSGSSPREVGVLDPRSEKKRVALLLSSGNYTDTQRDSGESMSRTFEYDVFLSYSSKGKETVHALAERLKKDGLKVWLDAWMIQSGDSITRIDAYGRQLC